MKWELPPNIKVYEAIGAIADERVEISENTAKVYSSSTNKFYSVFYDPSQNAIMANDNGSYWKGYLGYPSIAFLMKIGALPYRNDVGSLMKGIAWKDINQKFKNDFEKTEAFVCRDFSEERKRKLNKCIKDVQAEIKSLSLEMLGKRTLPPEGY